MKLSIIIPVYNAEKNIKKTIHSIIDQNYDDYELILVNDGSTDSSKNICEEFVESNNRIKLINISNSGSGIARNVGISNASGEYCYFPDSDDVMTENSLNIIDNTINNTPADLYVFAYYIARRDGGSAILKAITNDYIDGNKIRENYEKYMKEGKTYIQGAPWNKVFKTEIIKKYNIQYPDLRRNQDEIFILRYMNKARNVKFVNEVIYTYYMNSLQDEWNKFPKNYFDIRTKVYKEFKDTIENWNKDNLNTKCIVNYTYLTMALRCMEFSFNPKWNLDNNQKKSYINKIVCDENIINAVSFIEKNKKYVKKYITSDDNTKLKLFIIFYQISLIEKRKVNRLFFISKNLIHIRKIYKDIKYGKTNKNTRRNKMNIKIEEEKKCFIITGGETFNKGAQAMTFVTIDNVRKMFKNSEIVLLSGREYNKKDEDEKIYKFKVLPSGLGYTMYFLGGIYKLISLLSGKLKCAKKTLNEIYESYQRANGIIDISGFALSSQWGTKSTINFLLNIAIAKKYKIPIYLMPQSFGPFEFKGLKKIFINYLMKKYLKYPTKIYCREVEGFNYLKKYTNENLEKSLDLVLLNKEIDLKNIYLNKLNLKNINIKDNSVGIIPNMRNFEHGNKDNIIMLYKKIINKLLEKNKNIYLIRHSYEDIDACKLLKDMYKDNEKVILVIEELNCIEFENTIKKFQYVIASRYHSIVHSYKNGIPCISLGWATKYYELLKTFNQTYFILDVRNESGFEKIEDTIDKMNDNYKSYSTEILNKLNFITKKNIFNVLRK